MSKHTPGPWKVSNYRPYDIIARDPKESTYQKGDDRFSPIATVDRYNTSPQEFLKNARLIAAAPELLEALKEARDQLCSYSTDKYVFDMIDKIDVVIEKAEGAT